MGYTGVYNYLAFWEFNLSSFSKNTDTQILEDTNVLIETTFLYPTAVTAYKHSVTSAFQSRALAFLFFRFRIKFIARYVYTHKEFALVSGGANINNLRK